MLKKCMKTLLAFLMIFSSLSLTTFAQEANGELIINDARIGSGLHQITYSGNWGSSKGLPERFYNGDEHWFSFKKYNEGDPLPYYSVRFKGTGVEVYGETQPVLGIYNIYIDGELVKTFDAYSAARVEKTKLFTVDGLAYGEHTLKVELSNTKNAAATNCDGEFDYIKVLGFQKDVVENQSVTRIEDSVFSSSNEPFKFKYNGEWKGESGYPNLFFNGDDHYSDKAGDSYEMSFTGSRIQVYGTKKKNHGNYDVELDGESVGTMQATQSTTAHKQLLFDSQELSYGEHHIKVTLPANAKVSIQVDCIDITHGSITADSIQINEAEFIGCKGMSFQATTSFTPWLATPTIEWSTSDASKAIVDENGLIEIVGSEIGECTITAKISGTEIKDEIPIQILPEMDALRAYVGTTAVTANQEFYMDYIINQENPTTWHEMGWKGDELLSSIVVLTKDEVTNLKVEASDFTNGEHVFSKDNIEIRWLKDVLANIGRSNPSAPKKLFADVIHKGGAIDAPAQKVLTSWINIAIPKDCEPGTYSGTITVSANELEEPYVFDYSFEVLNIVQPTSDDTATTVQFWQYPFAVAEYYGLTKDEFFNDTHLMYLRENLKEYLSLGARDLVATVVEEAWNHQCYYSSPSMVKWIEQEDGTFKFDYTWFDKWVELAIECGVIDPVNKLGQIKCYSIVPWGNKIGYTTKDGSYVSTAFTPGSSAWTNMWSQFLTDFMAHTEEKGWFDITYISLDERGITDLQHSIELIHSIQNEDGESFKISSALNYSLSGDTSFTDQIDDISMNYGHVPHNSDSFQAFCEHRRELGLVTTVYTCTGNYPSSFVTSDPIDASYAIWYTLYQNSDGYLRWAWDAWTNDPLTDVSYKSFEPGDMWFIYPTEKGEVSDTYYYSSPRYEMTKQAVRDINKAKYLMSLSDQLNDDIHAFLDTLGRPNKGTSYGSATYATQADRELTISETQRMRNTLLEVSKDYALYGTSTATKVALREALKQYEANYYNSLSYTKASYEPFKDVYEAALTIEADRHATQEAIDEVVALLSIEAEKLEEISIPTLSENLINTSAETDVKVIDVTSECVKGGNPDEDGKASNLLDYNSKTYWHTDYKNVIGMPQSITFDLGQIYVLEDLTFLPRQGAAGPGKGDPIMVKLYGGLDADNLTYLGSKAFDTENDVLANRDSFIRVALTEKPLVQYIKFEIIQVGGNVGNEYANAAEMRFYGSEPIVVEVDKTALETLVNKANELDPYAYKDFMPVMDALFEASGVLANENATQAEVDAALEALQAAIDTLEENAPVVTVDKAALNEAIAAAEALAEADYSRKSWSNLQTALTAAKEVAADENATQEVVDQAVSSLEAKKAALVNVVAAKEAIAAAEAKLAEADKYTDETVAELTTAYNNAVYAINSNIGYVQADADMHAANINNAIAALVEKPVEPELTAPAKVENVKAKDTDYKTITLTWDASETATAYDVYRKAYDSEEFKLYKTVEDTTVAVTGVMTGKEYAFYEVAKNEVGAAQACETVAQATTLHGKVTLAIEKVSTSKFKLSWNAIDGATRYIVYRKRNDDKMKKVLTLGSKDLTYTTAEMPNGDYQFVLKAGRYDSTDRVMTKASNTVKGSVKKVAPAVTLKADTKSIKVSWKKMEGVTHYQVYRATSEDGKYTKLTTTKELSYTAKSLSSGKKYFFKVRGYKTYKSGEEIKYSVYTPYSTIKYTTAK